MKLAISIIVGLLIALLILKFTNFESYVLAPVTYERSMDFNPGDEEARIIRAVAAASGTTIDDNQAKAILAASAPPVGPPPIMPIPGTVTPMMAPSPTAAQQIMEQPQAVLQAAQDARAAQAAQAARADMESGGVGGGAFTGGGGVGSITQITGGGGFGAMTQLAGGGAPLMGGALSQPITAGAAEFGVPSAAPRAAPPLSRAPAPAPRAAPTRAPAPAPRAAPTRAPAPRGPTTRREVLLDEIDDIIKKLHT